MAALVPYIVPGLAAIGGFSILQTGSQAVGGMTNPGGGTQASQNGGFFDRLDTLTTLLLIGGVLFLVVEGKKALK